MTLTHTPPVTVKRPAWLLILTLPAFIAYLAVAGATIAQEAESSSAELTPAEVSDLGLWWVVLHLLWMTPSVLAAIGVAQVARRCRLSSTAAVTGFACAALALAAAYLVVQVLAFGFDGETWGDSRLYPLGVGLSVAAGWAGTLPATILVAVSLAKHGIATRTAWTVAALTGLYFVFELLVYLPALVGPATVAETTGLPPFLLGIFWACLGGGLLRARVPSEV
jgi:hypothetical protein